MPTSTVYRYPRFVLQVVGQQRIENGTVNDFNVPQPTRVECASSEFEQNSADVRFSCRGSCKYTVTVKVFRNWLTNQVATLNVTGDEWMWMAIRSMFPQARGRSVRLCCDWNVIRPDRIVQFCRKRITTCVWTYRSWWAWGVLNVSSSKVWQARQWLMIAHDVEVVV